MDWMCRPYGIWHLYILIQECLLTALNWRQYGSLTCWYLCTIVHGVIYHKVEGNLYELLSVR